MTATVPGVALSTGTSILVSPAFLGRSIFTTGALLESSPALTPVGIFTASPDFLASERALSLTLTSVWVLPFSSVLTVVVTSSVLAALPEEPLEDPPPPPPPL